MNIPLATLLCATLLTGWAAAQLPKKPPLSRYSGLWNNSPFTSKPPPVAPGEIANPLADYALGGVSPITGGYRVTLLNKKNPEERVTLETNLPNKLGFSILGVTRQNGDAMGTSVRIQTSSGSGTVAYDDKLLVLSAPKPTPAAQPVPGQPGQPAAPPGVDANGEPLRQPRPRVVAPPAPDGQPAANGQPGAAPHPAQGRSNSNRLQPLQRAERRR